MTTKLTPLQLNEAAARRLGYEYITTPLTKDITHFQIITDKGLIVFDPYHDMNDLTKVVERLPEDYRIIIRTSNGVKEFRIEKMNYFNAVWEWRGAGSYPAEYNRMVLELVEKLEKEGK